MFGPDICLDSIHIDPCQCNALMSEMSELTEVLGRYISKDYVHIFPCLYRPTMSVMLEVLGTDTLSDDVHHDPCLYKVQMLRHGRKKKIWKESM